MPHPPHDPAPATRRPDLDRPPHDAPPGPLRRARLHGPVTNRELLELLLVDVELCVVDG